MKLSTCLAGDDVSYSTTQRGKKMLIYKGYPFLQVRASKTETTWVCRQKEAFR
jgi:hypothetical protein